MLKRRLVVLSLLFVSVGGSYFFLQAQYTPWLYWTFLPKAQVDEIIGESSGELAWSTIAEINAFNRLRTDEEYAENFFETKVIAGKLKKYGLAGVEIVAYPGGDAWRPLKGELWEEKPWRQKIASLNDQPAVLAAGSTSVDVTAELVWIGRGTLNEIKEANVNEKIAVTEGELMSSYVAAVGQGALGVVAISQSRPYFDPLQLPWAGISFRGMGFERVMGQTLSSGDKRPEPKFAFILPFREGDFLKQRLISNEKIVVRAQIETKMEKADLENITCFIPGEEPAAGEIILSAHLFEGFIKQGANDNISGSAAILETARVLNTLISEGRLPKPKRTIRFIWGPEFSGIGEWVRNNKKLMKNTLCNINLDMVGEWLTKNKAFFCLMRTSYGNPHYVNDVVENYFRFVGEGNRERIQNRSLPGRIVPKRIVAPFGADEPFYYSIETNYGASDHEVFNDWAVGVPGVMMLAWPDQWYHTSGDLADKADPTQLKRAVIIAAASAYTIAAADEDMAIRIAAETASNASRRLGHALVRSLEILNNSSKESLAADYKSACWILEAVVSNEKETLDSIVELSPKSSLLGSFISQMKKKVDVEGHAQLQALEARMNVLAVNFKIKSVQAKADDLEKKAARIIPIPTSKVKENGYAGYRKFISEIPASERAKFPFQGKGLIIASTTELQRLINGRRSALDIKKMLDAQHERKSSIEAILNYLEILKKAGLVEWKKAE